MLEVDIRRANTVEEATRGAISSGLVRLLHLCYVYLEPILVFIKDANAHPLLLVRCHALLKLSPMLVALSIEFRITHIQVVLQSYLLLLD